MLLFCCSTVNKCIDVDWCGFLAIVTCRHLNVSNSVLNTTDSNFTTAVQIVCDAGYAIDPLNLFNNSISTVCMSSGNWSMFPIECQRKSQRLTNFKFERVRILLKGASFFSVQWRHCNSDNDTVSIFALLMNE